MIKSAENLAFLIADKKLYYSNYSPKSYEPRSAVTELIQGIYELDAQWGREILRNRIFTTYQPSEMCLNMVKVAAKRVTRVSTLPHPRGLEFMQVSFNITFDEKPRLQSENRFENARDVRATLQDENGNILEEALNDNAQNKTLHAEVKLVQKYFARTGKALPPHSTIHTSLKPCRMCAAMIWHACEKPKSLKVKYDEFDPGRFAQNTVLDQHGLLISL